MKVCCTSWKKIQRFIYIVCILVMHYRLHFSNMNHFTELSSQVDLYYINMLNNNVTSHPIHTQPRSLRVPLRFRALAWGFCTLLCLHVWNVIQHRQFAEQNLFAWYAQSCIALEGRDCYSLDLFSLGCHFCMCLHCLS